MGIDESVALRSLRRRHVLLTGCPGGMCEQFVAEITSQIESQGTCVLRLPESIDRASKYFESIRHVFPFDLVTETPRADLSIDALSDLHLEWFEPMGESCFVVWPNVDLLNSLDWFGAIVSDYLSAAHLAESLGADLGIADDHAMPTLRLLATTEQSPSEDDLYERCELYVGERTEDRTDAEIARSHWRIMPMSV